MRNYSPGSLDSTRFKRRIGHRLAATHDLQLSIARAWRDFIPKVGPEFFGATAPPAR